MEEGEGGVIESKDRAGNVMRGYDVGGGWLRYCNITSVGYEVHDD